MTPPSGTGDHRKRWSSAGTTSMAMKPIDGNASHGDDAPRRERHDEPLGRPLLAGRAAAHSPLEKRAVPSQEIERREGRRAREDRQVYPRLPVVDGPRRDEQQKPHDDGECNESEPGPRSQAFHSAATRPDAPTRAPTGQL